MSVETLRPLIRRFGLHLKKVDGFLQEFRLGFSNVISTLTELDNLMPQLVEIYASEMFSTSEFQLFKDFHEILNQKLHKVRDRHKLIMRRQYRDGIRHKVDYFKGQLRETLFLEHASVSNKILENETDCEDSFDEENDEQVFTNSENTVETVITPRRQRQSISSGVNDANPSSKTTKTRTSARTKCDLKFPEEKVRDVLCEPLLPSRAGSRSLTNCKPITESESLETKQLFKRKRKRHVKKLSMSVLHLQKTKNVKHSHYYAYANEKLAHYSATDMAKFFEEEGGFLAFSMVKDLRVITPEERQIIEVFEQIRKRYTKELTTNTERRLINKASGGVHSANFTTQDNLRRAVSISFGPAVKSLQVLVENYVQQFINLGLVHPDTKAGNALGKPGLELLFKGSGLDDQVPHFDFPNFQRSKKFLSYRHSIQNKVAFDERLDGGCSLFINHSDREDTLSRADGTLIVIPPYSYCILRGNVAHYGTGNSEDDAIYKFFCYLDPVKYYRATNKYKDSVFLFNEYRNIIRHAQSPFTVVLNTSVAPYYCVYCYEQFHYTYPLCSNCMLVRWKLKLQVDKSSNRVICTNGSNTAILAGHVFPDPFKKGFMSNEEYARVYSAKLKGEKIGCVQVSETHVQNWLSYKSLLAHVRMQPTDYNVVLEYDSCNKEGWLKVVQEIAKKGELILKGEPSNISTSFLIDIDEYALTAIADDHMESDMLVRAAHHGESSEQPLEVDGDDGMFYEDDEEYGSDGEMNDAATSDEDTILSSIEA